MSRLIEVMDYQQDWPVRYQILARTLSEVFAADLVKVDHIGSTSVPGMVAKPVIDVLVTVKQSAAITDYYDDMARLGYACRGEELDAPHPGTPGRFYFSKDVAGKRESQVHVCHVGHFQIEHLLAFRDYLRTFPKRRESYSELKSNLTANGDINNSAYMDGKALLVRQLIDEALSWNEVRIG